jgi:hypothetical protein
MFAYMMQMPILAYASAMHISHETQPNIEISLDHGAEKPCHSMAPPDEGAVDMDEEQIRTMMHECKDLCFCMDVLTQNSAILSDMAQDTFSSFKDYEAAYIKALAPVDLQVPFAPPKS